MDVREGIGLLAGVLVLAGLSVAIVNGTQTAAVLDVSFKGFTSMVRAATMQSG